MGSFKIDVTELHWIDGDKDDPNDLCLHGHAVAEIGNTTLEYDATVSATALYLLKSLTEDHIIYTDNQMLPCCGYFYCPDEKRENIHICGCPNGIDWTVRHNADEVIIILENGNEERITIDDYKKEVFNFADKIEKFYNECTPKILPNDEFEKMTYEMFWNEWHRRRNG